MKCVILLSLVTLCYSLPATYGTGKSINISDDGTITITTPDGKKVVISKAIGAENRFIDVSVEGPNVLPKRIQIDSLSTGKSVNVDNGGSQYAAQYDYYADMKEREKRSPKVTEPAPANKTQGAILAEVFTDYQGVVDDKSYINLLAKVSDYVESGKLDPSIYDVLAYLNEQRQQVQQEQVDSSTSPTKAWRQAMWESWILNYLKSRSAPQNPELSSNPQQPWNSQPWSAQPIPGQPWNAQPWPQQTTNQQWTGQPWNAQQTTGQQWAGQPWNAQQTTGQQWPGQQSNTQPWAQQTAGQPWNAQPWTQQTAGQQSAGQPWNTQPWNAQPWTQQTAGQQSAGQPWNAQPWTQQTAGQQPAGQPWNAQPWTKPAAGQSWNSQPWNVQPTVDQQWAAQPSSAQQWAQPTGRSAVPLQSTQGPSVVNAQFQQPAWWQQPTTGQQTVPSNPPVGQDGTVYVPVYQPVPAGSSGFPWMQFYWNRVLSEQKKDASTTPQPDAKV